MTTITEPKKKHRLTQVECDMAKYMLEHGRTLKEIGEIIGVDPSTVGKIRLADYNLEKYLEQRKAMNRKTKENKKKRTALSAIIGSVADEERDKKILDQLTEEREAEKAGMTVEMYRFCKQMRKEEEERKRAEQVPGQIQMELPKAEGPCARSNTVIPREHTLIEFEKKLDERRFQAAMMDKLLKKLDELIEAITRGRQ